MEKERVEIIALTKSETHPKRFALVLENERKTARISVTVGKTEAQAIACILEKIEVKRPQTHDLLYSTIEALGGKVTAVEINQVVNDAFHANIILEQNGQTLPALDARTSDAIALAVRSQSPIFVTSKVLNAYGFGTNEQGLSDKQRKLYKEMTLSELEFQLSQLLEVENYKEASVLRDAIAWKKKQV